MNKFVNILGTVTAFGALIMGVVKGDVTYTAVGVGIVVLLRVIGVDNKLAKIEKEMAK